MAERRGVPDCVDVPAQFQDASLQGTVLWESPALVVYTADWDFQLVQKILRRGAGGQAKDLSDAVALLNKVVDGGNIPINSADIEGWFPGSRKPHSNDLKTNTLKCIERRASISRYDEMKVTFLLLASAVINDI
jgi:hypothetical protein